MTKLPVTLLPASSFIPPTPIKSRSVEESEIYQYTLPEQTGPFDSSRPLVRNSLLALDILFADPVRQVEITVGL